MILVSGLMSVLVTLVVTVAVETAVAALFRIGRRGLLAVVLVNVVTNPLFDLGIVVAAWSTNFLGAPSASASLLVVLLLEVVVVVAEWRLLVWALRGTAGDPRRLLVLSIAMNVASTIPAPIVWLAT